MDEDQTNAAAPSDAGPRASLSLLRRNRDFRALFFASVISLGGDWFLWVAINGLIFEATEEGALRRPRDPRPGVRLLPRVADRRSARGPDRPPQADDRLRSRPGGGLRRVPAGRTRDDLARVRAAARAGDVRGTVRPRPLRGHAERRRPAGSPGRERAERLAVGNDARRRRGARRPDQRRVRRRHGVPRGRRLLPRVGGAALLDPAELLRVASGDDRTPGRSSRPPRRPGASPAATTASCPCSPSSSGSGQPRVSSP